MLTPVYTLVLCYYNHNILNIIFITTSITLSETGYLALDPRNCHVLQVHFVVDTFSCLIFTFVGHRKNGVVWQNGKDSVINVEIVN